MRIQHLLVWTACVAVCLSLSQTSWRLLGANQQEQSTIFAALGSLAGGAALGGLVLLAARRRRGIPFPVYPGEFLLVVLGGRQVLALAAEALLGLSDRFATNLPVAFLLMLAVILYLLGQILLVLWALGSVNVSRWRAYFSTVLVSQMIFCCHGIMPLWLMSYATFLLPTPVLIVVLLKDRADGRDYPWTHWVGIGTALWLDALIATSMIAAGLAG